MELEHVKLRESVRFGVKNSKQVHVCTYVCQIQKKRTFACVNSREAIVKIFFPKKGEIQTVFLHAYKHGRYVQEN
jgi:hypothetical protein